MSVDVLAVIARHRAALAAGERHATRQMHATWRRVERTLRQRIADVDDSIARYARDGRDGDWLTHERARLVTLQQATLAQVEAYAQAVEGVALARANAAAAAAPADAAAAIAAVTPANVTADIVRLPSAAVRDMQAIARSNQFRGLFQRLGTETGRALATELGDVITTGLAEGKNPRSVARDMRRLVALTPDSRPLPVWRAETIARTETMRAYRTATIDTYRQNTRVVRGWVWISALDRTTCASCIAQHGTVHPLTEEMATHPRCFPAGTVVSGPRAHASTERWYEGDLVEIETAGARRLSVTPNHPLLTPYGWVAAGELQEGDDLVCSRLGDRMAAALDPDDEQVPSLIEHVAHSLGGSGSVASGRMPTAAEDFHGDGTDGEVCVVRADGLLRDRFNATVTQPAVQETLRGRYMGLPLLTGPGDLALVLEGQRLPADSCVSCGDVAPVLLAAAGFHHEAIRSGGSSPRDVALAEYPINRDAGDPETAGDRILGLAGEVALDDLGFGEHSAAAGGSFCASERGPFGGTSEQPTGPQFLDQPRLGEQWDAPGNGLRALAGQVSLDRVLKITRRSFRGHVFNLETSEGWYSANGIVAHNCRCVAAPQTVSWSELGGTGADPVVETGPEWFRGQDADTQRAIAGTAAKYRALRGRSITLPDLVERTSGPWGPSTREAGLDAAHANARARRAAA